MKIGLDYDNTITRDFQLWEIFVDLCLNRGHEVIIVTGRAPDQPISFKTDLPVVYAGNQWKSSAARSEGHLIDVWIDDEPGHIEPSKKLLF